jgi:AcrR family transcriptional regulator
MASGVESTGNARAPLSRDRVLHAAIALADRGGIESVTMRKVADELGVEAMSLYHHVANKEDMFDGMVDEVFSEIELPSGGDWKEALRRRALSARRVLSDHRWAIGLMDSRTSPGPATLRHHDAVIGTLREGGFSIAEAAHAFAILDSFIYGFALQEASLPLRTSEEIARVAGTILEQLPDGEYSHLRQMTAEHVLQPGYDFGSSYEIGLDLVLSGLEGLRGRPSPPPE